MHIFSCYSSRYGEPSWLLGDQEASSLPLDPVVCSHCHGDTKEEWCTGFSDNPTAIAGSFNLRAVLDPTTPVFVKTAAGMISDPAVFRAQFS